MIVARFDPDLSARITSVAPLHGVRAGSALALVGGRLLVAQDDAFTLVWVDPTSWTCEPLILRGDGAALPKDQKPDFEAALLVDDAAAVVLGSGSAINRRWIAAVDVDANAATLTYAERLYDALHGAIGGAPNIEGAVRIGDLVRLLHRGSGRPPAQDVSAALDVPLWALTSPDADGARVLAMNRYDLGSIGGVPLTFTDAASVEGGRSALYLAVAEDTPDAIADGPILGAAIGLFEDGGARYARLLEADGSPCIRKPEGITLDPGGRSGFLVTDADNPSEPAELCRFTLDGPW